MKITRQEDIALLVLSELTTTYGIRLMPISEIGHKHGVSLLFLKKIVRSLRQVGLIISKEGINGGYELAKHPREITLLDILSPFSDTQFRPSANQAYGPCPLLSTCLPQQITQKLTHTINHSFAQISLVQLAGGI